MSPNMNYGDAFIVYRSDFNSLKPNDVVVFKDPRGNPATVVHRIISVNLSAPEPYVITKGDNDQTNPTEDPWQLTNQYYNGKVILVIPYVGYLSPALWGLNGSTFIVLAVGIILTIWVITYIIKKYKVTIQETT